MKKRVPLRFFGYNPGVAFVTPIGRLALGVLAAAALASASACSDDPVDPIVRLTDAPQGTAGSGPGGDLGDLCAPCDSRLDCAPGESCVELERGGERFCSRTCGDGTRRCPQDYVCTEVFNLTSLACVPETGECTSVIP